MNLAATADEPPIELFQFDRAKELRGWTTPEGVYRGRGWPPPFEPPNDNPYTLVTGVEHMIDFIEGRVETLLVGLSTPVTCSRSCWRPTSRPVWVPSSTSTPPSPRPTDTRP